jgi:tetratricopeptide (TPR) repeat protein
VRRFTHLLLSACATLATAPCMAQMSGAELMQEGNALARDGIYRTALLRYREAAAAGLDTPLLHHNVGVAYYRLGEYGNAAQEFERAAAAPDERLQAIAQYNLGLARRAAGDRAGAESAFRSAADSAPGRSLRRLADHASSVVAAPPVRRDAESEARRAAAYSPEANRVGALRFSAAARVGQDDNVYRTPAEPYVDFSDPAQPVVTPTVQAGSFVPVDIFAAYVLRNEADDTDFSFAYELDGDFYGSEFANADRIAQRFSIGADIVLGEAERRRRTVQSAFFVRDHRETDFDPDDGISRDIDGADISERFSYVASGVEGEFEHALGDWRWGFDMRLERREYVSTPPVANYDQEYYLTTASVEYDFSRAMTLSLGLRRYRRLYDERLARDLNGDLLATNSAQHYDYRGVQLGVARRVTRSLTLDLDFLRLDRIDEFLGYNDYTQDVLRLRALYTPSARFSLAASALGRTYDFPSAFAFNEPTAGARELDGFSAEVSGEFLISPKWSLWAELIVDDVSSTDARAAYARTRTTLGGRWRF